MRFPLLAAAVIAIAIVSGGCDKDDPLPPLGPSTGNPLQPTSSSPRPGGGGDGDGDGTDGGTPGLEPLPVECAALTFGVAGPPIISPFDFAPTHLVATWSTDCSDPLLVLALADDGCPDGEGHELSVLIRADAVGDSLLPGANPLTDRVLEDVAITYARPETLVPSGTWSSCSGTFGSMELISLNPDAGGSVDLRLSLELPDCAGMGTVQRIEGRITTLLRRDRRTACPDR